MIWGEIQPLILTDYQRYVRAPLINKEFSFFLNNKMAFHVLLNPFPQYQVELVGAIEGGRILNADLVPVPDQWFWDQLRQRGRLVAKPVRGAAGSGVMILRSEACGIRLGRERGFPEEVLGRVKQLEDGIITEFVAQHPLVASFFPENEYGPGANAAGHGQRSAVRRGGHTPGRERALVPGRQLGEGRPQRAHRPRHWPARDRGQTRPGRPGAAAIRHPSRERREDRGSAPAVLVAGAGRPTRGLPHDTRPALRRVGRDRYRPRLQNPRGQQLQRRQLDPGPRPSADQPCGEAILRCSHETVEARHSPTRMSKIGFEPILPAGALTPKNLAWSHAGKIRSLVEDWRGASLDASLMV
jgi:hypothetical protein